jgi:long-subunit acyl-CoA synthetase (AMP-forming)/ribosomal protein S18 acetylase RimI-like enzyme
MTSVADLQDLTQLSADQVAARVSAVLEEAARPGTPTEEAERLDRAAVTAVGQAPHPESVLEHVDPGQIQELLARCSARCGTDGALPDRELRLLTWDALDLARRPVVVQRIERGAVDDWTQTILAAVEASHLTVGPLFRQRAKFYGPKILFEIPEGAKSHRLTWQQVAARVDTLARGLLSLDDPDANQPIAIVSENRLELAITDLACLTSGLVNVVVPANATEADVGYILRHAKVRTVVVSGRGQLHKVQKNREALPDLQRVISMDALEDQGTEVMSLRELEGRASRVSGAALQQRGEAVRIDDLATVMYTSGTTGMPKGIQYSHRNLVFKRFARGIALPEIGDRDVFLCYLPLFHTFGRYLEMLGCVFWGAKYCFLLDPSMGALTDGMTRYRPTVFISVPRKWMQLYDGIAQRASPLEASDEELLKATQEVTGGRLAWGLSAAGYLDPEIFKFFHRQGIQLLSGFGMSEATGGATMTPPHEYKDDSLGVALPGIELELADDGELLMRGPYVMMGYLDPPDGEPSFDEDGWLHSGDLMRMDDAGHIRLVDRKKEIYKNVKGQTIAPQRIENLFREFESVGRVFLVGDHREYNTLLIYPNPEYGSLDFSSMSIHEIRDHFRSLVTSVNQFVAPFERIVDFYIIDRDLDADRGELTPKGTPRRKTVVENFAHVIDSLYRRAHLHVGGVELTLPNWLFQYLGLTAQDVEIDKGALGLPSVGSTLTVRRLDETQIQIGAGIYETERATVNLGAFLATPRLWLGNEELVEFAPLQPNQRQRPGRSQEGIGWAGRPAPYKANPAEREALLEATRHTEWTLDDLDRAARLLSSADREAALAAERLLERVVANEEGPLAEPARFVLARGAVADAPEVRRRAFQTLVPVERAVRFMRTLKVFFGRDPALLDEETSEYLAERNLSEAKIQALIAYAEESCTSEKGNDQLALSLLGFLAQYGAGHPVRFRTIRAFLVRMSLFARSQALRVHAGGARVTLENGFRQWLGPTSKIAVDTETGQEYRWEDVVVFEESTPDEHRRRLLTAIKSTPFLREAVFLFYRGTIVRLHDIPPGGVWIRLLGTRHGKSVYRVTIQTRAQETYEVAANLVDELESAQVQEEIDWLILCGAAGPRDPVVEDFGGHIPEQDLWSEEFVSGDTLDRELRRLARRASEHEGLRQLWPFLAWSALAALVDFWDRTGRRCEITELSPADIVLPTHDYHRGSRIVSLSARHSHRGLLDMVHSVKEGFVRSVEDQYSELNGVVGWDVTFSAVLEVIGEQEGLDAYERALKAEPDAPAELRQALEEYLFTVRRRGFLPKRLYFAAKRYRRWAKLNEDATPQARAATLQEFYDTYGLDTLAMSYPEVRLRFFRETVFRDSTNEVQAGLDELTAKVRSGEIRNGELAGAVADLRQRLPVEPDDDYFLARIPFAYLRPEDAVDFVSADLAGSSQSEIVVALEDADAGLFRVRHALLPREVERLHRLFLSARLDVQFGPEHRYLVGINERDQIIGGIYYEIEEDGQRAHLEKIVVAEAYRRKGVADGLMKEFFNRLRAAGVRAVTTGFFRPEYFYAHGFKIEKRYAGLVKSLEDGPEAVEEV